MENVVWAGPTDKNNHEALGHMTRRNGSLADGNAESEAAKFALFDQTPIDGVAHQFGIID